MSEPKVKEELDSTLSAPNTKPYKSFIQNKGTSITIDEEKGELTNPNRTGASPMKKQKITGNRALEIIPLGVKPKKHNNQTPQAKKQESFAQFDYNQVDYSQFKNAEFSNKTTPKSSQDKFKHKVGTRYSGSLRKLALH